MSNRIEKVLEFAGVKYLLNVPFLNIVENDGSGRWLGVIWQWIDVPWLEQ